MPESETPLYAILRSAAFPRCTSIGCLLLAALSVTGPSFAQSFALSGWDAVWQDEFNGDQIDYSRWEVADREFSPNNELQYYRPEQVSVSNGQLQITAINQPLASKPYRSGLIRTWEEHRYGRWEVRADLPWGQGMWPAIWLLPRNADWPVGGEIDIMENVGNNTRFVKGSYHYNWTPGSPITSNQDYITGEDFAAGMHTYAVEWEPNAIRFYVDDNLYHTVDNPIQPAEVPMSLIINLAVGGDWPGSPDGSTVFPQTFDIDYARYWTRDEAELINSGFNRSGSTMNGWTVFGNEVGNVSAQTEAAFDGDHSLKLFGQFNGEQNYSGVAQGISVTPGQQILAGARSFVSSQDSIVGTDNEVIMKLEYYSSFDGAYGAADYLGEQVLSIADGTTSEDNWNPHQISGIVPEGAVEARVSFVFSQPGLNGGAVFIDTVSLLTADPPQLPGDYNSDGQVDLADYTVWRDGGSPDSSLNGYNLWMSNFGASNSTPASSSLTVPEPIAALLLAASLAFLQRR